MINADTIFKIRRLTKFFFAGVLLFLLIGIGISYGADRYSVASNRWDRTQTWSATSGGGSGASVPVAGDNVYIEGNRTVTISNAAAACTNVSIASGSTLSVGGYNVTVSGTTTVYGTITHTNTAGTKSYGNVVIAGGIWTSNVAETYAMNGFTLSGSTINGSNTGIINVGANLSVTSGTTNTLNAVTITVTGTTTIGGSMVVASNAGTKIFVGQTTISSTGVWDNDNVNESITFRGGLTSNGTFYAGTSVYTFDTNSQIIAGTLSIPNVTVAGVTLTNNGALTVGTALSGNGRLTQGTTGILNLGGTSGITNMTATNVGNTVNYTGAAQTVKAVAYYNLAFSGSGAKSVATGTSVAGNLSIGSATASIGAGLNISVANLTLGGLNKINGTWGSTSSTATNKDNTYFAATTGYITVTTDTRPTAAFGGIAGSQVICFGTSTVALSGAVSSGSIYPANGETVGVTINGVTQNATIAGGVGGFTINYNSAAIPSSGTPYTITYSYTGDVNLKAAPNNTSTTLTVNAATAIGSQSTAAQTQCLNGTFTAISVSATGTGTLSYQWYSNTTPSTTGGTLLAGATNSSYTPLATVAGTLYYYCIVHGSCGADVTSSVSGAFIVNPPPAQPSVITGSASPCQTSSQVYSVTNVSGVTYTWTFPSGWTQTGGGTTNSVTVTVGAGFGNVQVTPSTACGSGTARTLAVTPSFSVGGTLSGGTSPLCLGSSTGTMTLTGNTGTIIQWERQINTGGWSNIGNGGIATFAETPYSAGSWQYRVLVKNGTCTSAYSLTNTITVDAATVAGWISGGSAPVCQGSNTGTLTLNGNTGSVVRWEKRLNSGSWVNITNTLTTYSEIPSSGGTWEYRALVQSGSCVSAYATSFSITVIPTLTITLGANPIICRGTTTALLTYSATTGPPTAYSIDFDAAANTAGMVDVSGSGLNASPIQINVPWNITAGVYNGTLSVATTYPVCSSVGYPITVTVSIPPAITSQSTATQTQCINGTFSAISVTATGTVTYQWYSNTTASTTGGTLLAGATNANYTPLATSAGTLYYYCVVHSNCGTDVTSAISGAFIVNPGTAISSQSTATQTQCLNGSFTPISVTASGTGTITYQWYKNATASTTGGTLLAGATNASYTPLTTSTGTLYYYSIVHTNCGADVTSAISGAFIVNSGTAITSQSTATQTTCVNGTFSAISVSATGAGTITYQWYSNAVASTTGGTLLTGSTNANYTPSAAVAGTLYYYCIVHSSCGADVTSSISGAFIANTSTTITSQSTATQSQCLNGTFTAISVTASGTGAITYQWYKNTTASTTGGTLLPEATYANYTPSAAVAGTLYYYCIVHSNCGADAISAISGAFIVTGAIDVTAQTAVAGNTTALLSWTNPTSCYTEILVVAKAVSSVSGTPSGDGSGYTASLTYGSGTAFGGGFIVYKGIASPQTVTSLTNGTQYYFKFFTRFGTVWSSGVETNVTPTIVSLTSDYFRSRASGNWNATAIWESSHDGINWFNATLTPTSAANTITIQNTHTVTVTASVAVDQVTVNNGGQLTVNAGQTLTIADGAGTDLTVNGTLVNSGTITTTGTMVVSSGGTYQHAQDGGTIPTASWNASSTCSVIGITTTPPTGFGQTFGNFVWNCPSQTVSSYSTDGDITVNGNFTLSAGFFTLNNSLVLRTITINGNYIQTGGIFDFNTGVSGTSNMYLNGNLNLTSVAGSMTTNGVGAPNGIIIFNGSGIQTMNIPTVGASIWVKYSIPSGKNVQLLSNITLSSADLATQAAYQGEMLVNGTLDLGTYTITQNDGVAGTAVFTINSGANLITSNAGGISGSVSATNMTTTFSSGANYEFRGALTGTFTTTPAAGTVNNLTINRSLGVTLSQGLSVNGVLNLANGIFTTSTANLLSITNTSSTAITGGSTTNYISGSVRWTLPSSLVSGSTYIFPIGKSGTYLPFSLVNPTTGAGVVTVEVEAFAANSGGTLDATLLSKSATEYWSLATAGNFTNSSVSLTRQSAITPLDVIGGCTTLAGAYTTLSGTAGAYGVTGSNAIGTNRFFVLAEKNNSITTGNISGSPFCAGAAVSVPFTISKPYNANNFFTAQLSNASGSFAIPVTIGTLVQPSAGTITSTIPVGTAGGTGYRIRVVSSNPVITGTDNGSDLTVDAVPAQPSLITGSATPCQTSSQSYSVTNVAGVAYTWALPSGWLQTGGGTSSSITVTVGSGSGNITVTPSNTCGIGTTPRTLAVAPTTVPAQTGAISGSGAPCQGTSQTYSVSNISGVTYNWLFPTGWTQTAGGTTNSVTVTVGAGSGFVQVTPSNTCGNGTPTTLSVAPTAIPAQPSVITGSTTPCRTSSQIYSVTNVLGVTYTWTFPTGWAITAGGTTNSVTVTIGSGSGNVQVTPSNSCGNGTAQTLAVVTTAAVPAQPSTIAGSANPCQTTSQVYTVTNVAGVTYNWIFPAGWTQTGGGTSNSVIVTVGANSGVVRVTPSNSCGNGAYRDLTVTSRPLPAQPSAITGNASPCQATSQIYTVTNVSGLTYAWIFPAGWTQTAGGTANSVTVTVGSGSGNIQVTPSSTYCSGTSSILAVAPTTIPAQPSTITGSAAPCTGSSQVYSVTNVGSVTYTWTFPTGWTKTAGGTTNSVTVTVGATAGNVQVTPSNSCGNGTVRTLAAAPIAGIPAQPSTITGSAAPCQTYSQTYSVTNVAGVTYTWTFPSGWTQTAGGTTNSVTVTVGSGTGNVQVVPSTSCGSGAARTLAVTSLTTPAAPTVTGGLICIGSTATLSVSGAAAGDVYKWYSAATGGTLLKTSTNNTDNTYVTPVIAATTNYWVAILNTGGCEGPRTLVTATFPAASPDVQTLAGTDSWIGHVYDGMTFTTYYGTYTENETFNQEFGGNTTCWALNSSLGARSIYSETMSVKYRMNSTKHGLYIADLGSDDGSRLTVDGTLLYNDWIDQAYTAVPRVLMNLSGTSSLLYEYYENGGANQIVFQNLTQVMSNTLTTNTFQNIQVGGILLPISGDVFGTLPTGITLSGTGYQWAYSTTPGGTRINITGATGATYTPNTSAAPFNTAGTYYVYRKVSLSSINNVAPNPYIATNESNAATITISSGPVITTSVSSLAGFSYALGFGPSAEQSFIVSGANLSANLTIAPSPSPNFEISLGSGAAFVPTSLITLSVSGGNISATNIYVRLKAGLLTGAVASENIVCSSNGMTPKNIACSGVVTSTPVITASPDLTGFTYPYSNGPSIEKSFTVSGTNLVSNVIVTPPTGFEISTTSGSGYVYLPISLSPTGGNLSSTIVYVRLRAGMGVGIYNENIVCSSTNATSVNVNCDGIVTGTNLILLSKTSLSGFIYTYGAGPSVSQSFEVSGTMLTNNMIITPAANYEISFSSGSGFQATPLTIVPTGGIVNSTPIYVRLKAGLAVATYAPDNVSVSSIMAITKSVGCSGAVVNVATLMVSKTTLTGFGYMSSSGGPSSPQSFTVSGASLSANVTLTPPINYEISLTSNGTYQSTAITLTRTGTILSPTTIYVRLKSGLTAGNYEGVNIPVVSPGATTKNILCVGIVFVSPLITAGGGGSACAGSTVNLTSVGESTIANRYWQGPNGYYSTAQNPVLTNVTSAMSGTYTVTGNVVVGGNLVTNGDFELGNTSFGSSYALCAQTPTGLYVESEYDVIANPQSRHPEFSTCVDHTSGTGKQMVVNGSLVPGVVIWTQSVPVTPGALYQFTYWVQSVITLAPSQLQLYVNGVAVGPIYTADLNACSWKQFAYNAASEGNTTLNLELVNQNTIKMGNDFALDDIVFQQIIPATSSVDLNVSPSFPVSVSLAASPNPTTTGTNVTFTATPVNGGLTPNYQWKVNGINVASGPSPTYSSTTLSNGDIVSVVLTSSLTCVTGNPATSNTVIMMMSPRVNYWYGFNSTNWGTATNWTAGYIPAAGDDVEFATVANYGSAAVRDLYVDIHRTIGSLIDATNKSTVIPSTKTLTVNRNLYLGSSAHINASAVNSTIEFAGTFAQTIPAATFTNDEVYDILINNSNNVTLYGTMRLLHEITANFGRLDATTTMPTIVYAGDLIGAQTIEMNRYINNSIYNLGIYNIFGVWLATTASILVPHDLTITRGVLTVPPGATLTVNNYTNLNYRAPKPNPYPLKIDYWSCLVLKSNSTLTGSFVHSDLFTNTVPPEYEYGLGPAPGTVKVERYMSHTDNWHLYSSPIKDQSIHGFLQYNPEIPDLYSVGAPQSDPEAAGIRDYNTASDVWNPYYYYPTSPATIGSIGLGKGFNIRTIYNYQGIVGTGSVDATGTPNLNTVSVALTKSAASSDNGWNCIGNPFTCALNIRNVNNDGFLCDQNSILKNTLQLDPNFIAIYVWDTNNITGNVAPQYIVINNATSITSVQACQGFFVKSKTGGGIVTFNKAMQFPNAALTFKDAVIEWPSIKLIARDITTSISTEVKFVTNTTKGMDPGYDAGIFRANPEFSIYSKLLEDNPVDYTLQCLPDQDYDQYVIPIGVDHKSGGQIMFSAETINLPSGCQAVLEDRLYNTFIRLDLKGAYYKTTVDADTKGTGRFFLHPYDAIRSNPASNKDIKVNLIGRSIFIFGEVSSSAHFYLYSADGKLITNAIAQNQMQNQLDASGLASGVYMLSIIDNNLKKTIKFVLEN